MNKLLGRAFGWCVLILLGAALALGVAWLTHLVHARLTTLLLIGAVVIGLGWLAGLVTLPWNLYFAAHRALAGMTVSRERGISVRDADEAEAGRLARRMLGFAIGAHVGTAIAAALIAYVSRAQAGYYVAGFFLITTAFRPAAAYLGYVRARIGALARESTYPRDDVTGLLHQVEHVRELVTEQGIRVQQLSESLRLADTRLTDSIAHTRQLLAANIVQLQGSQAADREACRSGRDDLGRRIDDMVRRMEATLDGLSDQQELLAGLRALVRMVRSEPA
jgi:hypothetical protein